MNNVYQKLVEARRIYLNPSIDLIKEHGENLEDWCYVNITKWPAHTHPIWDMVLRRKLDFDELKRIDEESGGGIVSVEGDLVNNLDMAITNKDWDYLDYVSLNRPVKKLVLKLVRKNAIVSNEVIGAIEWGDEPTKLTHIDLKKQMNYYILKQRLQDGNRVKVDSILGEILKKSEWVDQKVGVFEINRKFNEVQTGSL